MVVPTRNRRDLLDAAVRSLRRQTVGAPAVVVVDDASDTPVGPIDGVTVVRNPSALGAAGARNRGLDEVGTPWVAFCDDDDLWAPHKLARQLAALTAHPDTQWSYTGAVEVDAGLEIRGAQRALASGWIFDRLLQGNAVAGGGSTVLARTDLVRAVGGFAAGLRAAEDWDLWSRMAELAPVAAVDEPLVAWRRHPANKSATWSPADLLALESRFRARARKRGVAFEHRYAAQAAIDHAVASGSRGAAARAYWARFRRDRATRDAAAAVYVLLAPGPFARTKERAHRRSVPAAWEGELGWLAEVGADLTRSTVGAAAEGTILPVDDSPGL